MYSNFKDYTISHGIIKQVIIDSQFTERPMSIKRYTMTHSSETKVWIRV